MICSSFISRWVNPLLARLPSLNGHDASSHPQHLPRVGVVVLVVAVGVFRDQDRGTAVIVPDVTEDKGNDSAGRASDDVLAVHYPVRLVYCAALNHGVKLGAERVVPNAGTAKDVHLERLRARRRRQGAQYCVRFPPRHEERERYAVPPSLGRQGGGRA